MPPDFGYFSGGVIVTQGLNAPISFANHFSGQTVAIHTWNNTDNTSPISFGGNFTANNTTTLRSYRGNIGVTGNFTQTGTAAVDIRSGYDNNGTQQNAAAAFTVGGTFNVAGGAAKSLTLMSGDGSNLFGKSYFTDNSNRTFTTIQFRRGDANGTFDWPTFDGINQNPATFTLVTNGANGHITTNAYSGTTPTLLATGANSNITINGDFTGTGAVDLEAAGNLQINGNFSNTSTTGTTTLLAGRSTLTATTDFDVTGTFTMGQGSAKVLNIADGDGDIFNKPFFTGPMTYGTLSVRAGTDYDFGSLADPWDVTLTTMLQARTMGNAYFNSLGAININPDAGQVSGTYSITSAGNVAFNDNNTLTSGRLIVTTTTAGNTISITGSGAITATDAATFTTNNGNINITSANLFANQVTLDAGTAAVNISSGRTVRGTSSSSNLTYNNTGINVGGNYIAGLPGTVNITSGSVNNSGTINAQGSTSGSITINYGTTDLNLNNVTLRTDNGGGGYVNVNGAIYQNGAGAAGITTGAGSGGGTGVITINMSNGYRILGNGATLQADTITLNGSGDITLTNWNADSIILQNYNTVNGNVSITGNFNGDLVQGTAVAGNLLLTNTTGDFNLSTVSGLGTIALESTVGKLDFDSVTSTNNQAISLVAGTTLEDKDDVGSNIVTTGTLTLTAGGNIGGGSTLNTEVGTLMLNTSGTANVSELNDLILGTSTAIGSTTLLLGGNLTSTGTVAGTSLSVNTTGNIGASTASRFNSNLGTLAVSNVGDVYLNETNGLALTTNQNVNLLDINLGGNLTSSGTILATTFNVGTGTLGTSTASRLNTTVDTLNLTNTAGVYLNESNGLTLTAAGSTGPVNILAGGNVVLGATNLGSQDLSITLGGSYTLTQSGVLTAGTLTATTSTGNITLSNTSNDIATLNLTTNNANIAYADANGFAVSGLNVGTGDVSLTAQAAGNITQSAAITADALTLSMGSGSATLNHASNSINTLTGTATNHGSIAWTNNAPLTVNASNVGNGTLAFTTLGTHDLSLAGTQQAGTITLTTDTGDITQSAALIANLLNLTTEASITTLTHASNQLNQLTFNTGVSDSLTYSQANDLSVAGVSGTLNIITQGHLSTHGTLSTNFLNTTVGSNKNITLNHAVDANSNVTLATTGTGQITIGAGGSLTATNRTITLTSNSISANGNINAGASGTLYLKPVDTTATIGLGGGTGTWQLSTTTLSNLHGNQLFIGDSNTTGNVSIGNINLAGRSMSLDIHTLGTITDATPANDATANIMIDSGETLTLTGGSSIGTAQIGSAGLSDLDVDLGATGKLYVKTNNSAAYINAFDHNLTLGTIDVGTSFAQLSTDNGSILNGLAFSTPNLTFGQNSTFSSLGGATHTIGNDVTALRLSSSNPDVLLSVTASGQTNGVSAHFNVSNVRQQNVSFSGPGIILFSTDIGDLAPTTSNPTNAVLTLLTAYATSTGGSGVGGTFLFNAMQNPMARNLVDYVDQELTDNGHIPKFKYDDYLIPVTDELVGIPQYRKEEQEHVN